MNGWELQYIYVNNHRRCVSLVSCCNTILSSNRFRWKLSLSFTFQSFVSVCVWMRLDVSTETLKYFNSKTTCYLNFVYSGMAQNYFISEIRLTMEDLYKRHKYLFKIPKILITIVDTIYGWTKILPWHLFIMSLLLTRA